MIRNIIVLFLALLFGVACNLNQATDNEVVIDVDDDFRLTFKENLTTNGDDLIFYLESIENRECEADTLLIQVDNFTTAVWLDIDVINASNGCLPGLRPAQTETVSGMIKNERTALSIQLEDLIDNKGFLFKNEQDYTIEMETTHGFYLPYERLLRVPESSIWGYIGFTPAFREQAQTFLDRFQTLTQNLQVQEGYYGHFSVGKDQDLQVPGQESISIYTQPFLRSFKVIDKPEIRALFQEYREKYPSMKFVFYDSYGEKFE